LHLAAENGHSAAVRCLIEQGTNLNARTKSGQTPLIRAVVKANKAGMEILVNFHADTSLVDNYGRTATTWLKAQKKTNDEMLSTMCSDSASGETLDKRHLKQTVVNLSAKLLENGYADSASTFNELGHCFVMLGLAEYASFAFQQTIRITSDTEIMLHVACCDGCSMSSIEGTRFVCEVCPDTDLCSSCMMIIVREKIFGSVMNTHSWKSQLSIYQYTMTRLSKIGCEKSLKWIWRNVTENLRCPQTIEDLHILLSENTPFFHSMRDETTPSAGWTF
jgi:Zinc finger, ZZ type/Ankyrin repeats (3 copies)